MLPKYVPGNIAMKQSFIDIQSNFDHSEIEAANEYFMNISSSEHCTNNSARSYVFTGSIWLRFPNMCMNDYSNEIYKTWTEWFTNIKKVKTKDLLDFYDAAIDFYRPYTFKMKDYVEKHFNRKFYVYGVELNMLPAKSNILPHTDKTYIMVDDIIRVHLVLSTNDQSKLTVNGISAHYPTGSCFILNHHVLHDVQNPGNSPRLHLVVDMLLEE